VRDVAACEAVDAPEAVVDGRRAPRNRAVHPLELVAHDLVAIAVRERQQVREPLGRDERRQHAVTLRPRRAEYVLPLREAVRTGFGPDRALVHGDDLRRERMALGAQRAKAFGIDALDVEARRNRRGQGTNDGLGAQLLARGQRDAAGAAVDTYA